jgi:hypothetical protein
MHVYVASPQVLTHPTSSVPDAESLGATRGADTTLTVIKTTPTVLSCHTTRTYHQGLHLPLQHTFANGLPQGAA